MWSRIIVLCMFFIWGSNAKAADVKRLISLSGSLTETVAALGLGDRLVGVDRTSLNPPEIVGLLPKVGSPHTASLESILSLNPDTVLAYDDLKPPHALDHLRGLNIHVIAVPRKNTIEGACEKFLKIADGLGVPEQGKALVAQINQEMLWPAHKPRPSKLKRALFIQAMGNGPLRVVGKETSSAAIMARAGVENAVQSTKGYRPLNSEVLAMLNPDIILIIPKALARIGGIKGLKKIPGLKQSPAVLQNRIMVVDSSAYLGLSPSFGKSIRRLREAMYGQ